MPTGHLKFRTAFGNVSRLFRGARYGDPIDPKFTGILDDYPNASAAYSLRALSSGWLAGDVIEVRRSSDSAAESFTASQITNGDLISFTGAGDGFVSKWYDQSGNGNDATQVTTTSQPKIVDSGNLITQGVAPSIDFEPNQHLVAGVVDLVSTFQVLKQDLSNTYNSLSTREGSIAGISFDNQAGSSYVRFFGAGGVATAPVESYGLTYQVSSAFGVDGDFEFNINNTVTAINSSTVGYVSNSATPLNIGRKTGNSGGLNMDGRFQEIIIYSTDMRADIDDILSNINDFYSIY